MCTYKSYKYCSCPEYYSCNQSAIVSFDIKNKQTTTNCIYRIKLFL